MKRGILICLFCIPALLMIGCWDQNLLKDTDLILGTGFDLTPDGQVLTTFVIDKGTNYQVFSSVGHTPRDALLNIGHRMQGIIDTSKNRFILIGEELAKQDIYPLLEVFYRNPKSALNAKIAIVKGTAQQLLQTPFAENQNILMSIDKQLKTNEKKTYISKLDLQSLRTTMFDSGEDVLVPYLGRGATDISTLGLVMFNRQRMTGTLDKLDSTICLIIDDKYGPKAELSIPLGNTKKLNSFITFNVLKSKRDLQIDIQNVVNVTIDMQLKLEIIEFAHDHLDDKEQIAQLNKKIESVLTTKAKEIIKKLQKANCDALGIGRRLNAYHHAYWNSVNWVEEYPKIKMQPKITVEIQRHGISN